MFELYGSIAQPSEVLSLKPSFHLKIKLRKRLKREFGAERKGKEGRLIFDSLILPDLAWFQWNMGMRTGEEPKILVSFVVFNLI